MIPFASPMMGSGDFASAKLISSTLIPEGGLSATPTSLGAAAGDLAITLAGLGGPVSSGSGGGWTNAAVGPSTVLFWRRLTAGDMGAPINSSRGGPLMIYRGAASIVSVVTGGGGGSAHSATIGGFTRSAQHAGLFAATRADNDTDGGGVGLTAPASFAQRGSAYFLASAVFVLDRLTPPNPRYEGESFTLFWPGNSGNFYLNLFEFRSS